MQSLEIPVLGLWAKPSSRVFLRPFRLGGSVDTCPTAWRSHAGGEHWPLYPLQEYKTPLLLITTPLNKATE